MAKPIPIEKLSVLDSSCKEFPDHDTFHRGAVIPVDKPKGWTSFDVVKYVRNRIPAKKVGHAGTLDPLATGLLILCCGKATKSISQFQVLPKTYLAEITFGASTPSFDAASDITEKAEWNHIDESSVVKIIDDQFIGEIEQVPPIYSALWKGGVRMYELARKGVEVKPEPRTVKVFDIELKRIDLPRIEVKVTCGKGFYVRSLANDLGRALGSLGYLTALKRTEIGHFTVQSAWQTDDFNNWSRN